MNKISKLFIIVGIFLISLSSFLFLYDIYNENKAKSANEKALSIIKTNIEKKEEIKPIKKEETININGYDYIGTIIIPTLNIELPVMSKFTYNNLKLAPCRYYGSIYTDDLIICAHSYKTHFKNIINLKQNDKVIFEDINGNIYIYEVLEIEILSPNDVEEMIDNEFDLTLYTCTSDALNRVTVRCNKVLNEV